MKKLIFSVALLTASFNAVAQNGPGGGPPRWGVGIATIVSDSPYAGEGARLIPIPLISYEGEHFYFRGISAGWTFLRGEPVELSALTKIRMDGFSVNDLGRAELAHNGVDYRLLEDRDHALDAGLAVQWSGSAGKIEIELLGDVSATSDGAEVSIQYGYPVRLGKAKLTLKAGATWLSENNANYYYGTLDAELARGVSNYKPGAVTIPDMGVSYLRPMGKTWVLLATAKYSLLPDEIKHSVLVEPDTKGTVSVFIGISRGF